MAITGDGTEFSRRVHILNGEGWATDAGTDFWIIGAANGETAAVGAGKHTLDTHGWTATNITEDAGHEGDFLSSADDDPSSFYLDDANDVLQSPAIFGSYAHAYMASNILGYTVTELNAEFYSQYIDATTDEEGSQIGFIEGGGDAKDGANAVATVYSDGVNYRLQSSAAETAVGAEDDTAWHLWKIQIVAAGCYHWMDGTLVNSTVLALLTDKFPVSFGIGVENAGGNFQKLAFAHVWYA